MANESSTEQEYTPKTILSVDLDRSKKLSGLYPPLILPDSRQRIIVVSGRPYAGTYTVALNLASQISTQKPEDHLPILLLNRSGKEIKFLNYLIQAGSFSNSTIYIIPDIFEQGLDAEELSQVNIASYQKILENANSYLILTVTTSDESPFPANRGVKPIIADWGGDIEAVFDAYFKITISDPDPDSDDPLIKNLRANQAEIQKAFNAPELMERFFNQVFLDSPTDKAALDAIIARLSNKVVSAIRRHFRDVPFNIRLFAMLIALLEDRYRLDIYDAEELYFAVVQKLRQKSGLDSDQAFVDPRRFGMDEIIAQSGLKKVQANYVEFADPKLRSAVLDSEIANHQSLLWVVVELLLDEINAIENGRYPGSANWLQTPDHATLTFDNSLEVLAYLTGRVGIFREKKLKMLLNHLATSNSWLLNEVSSQIINALTDNPNHYEFILNVVTNLLPSEDTSLQDHRPDLYRSAAFTLSEIYSRIRRVSDRLSNGQPPNPKQVTGRLLNQLNQLLDTMAETCGNYDYYARSYRSEREAELESHIQRQSDPKSRDKGMTEGEIERLRDDLQQQIAGHLLEVVEKNLTWLLLTCSQLAADYPSEIVERINGWLEHGLNRREEDEADLNDRQIEQMLAVEEIGYIPESDQSEEQIEQDREAQKRAQQRMMLNDMAWRVGIVAAIYLYSESMIKPPEPPTEKPTNKTNKENYLESEENPVDTSAMIAGTPKERSGAGVANLSAEANPEPAAISTEDKTENPVAIADGQGKKPEDKTAATPTEPGENSPESPTEPMDSSGGTNKDFPSLRHERRKRNNLVNVRRQFLPLLKLLPNLLKSSDYNLTTQSFIRNLTDGDSLVRHYREGHIKFSIPGLDDILEQSPLHVALGAILFWYELMGIDEEDQQFWVDKVHPALLELVNTASHGNRGLIRQALFKQGWMESKHFKVRRVAMALLARSYVLDGMVMDLPGDRSGVILLDGSRRKDEAKYYKRAFELIQRVSAVTALNVYHLGHTEPINLGRKSNRAGTLPTSADLRPRRRYNRLIMPFLDPYSRNTPILDEQQTHFVLVLVPLVNITPNVNRGIFEDIYDLTDVLELNTPTMDTNAQKVLLDPFATDDEKSVARNSIQKTEWVWHEKLLLVTAKSEKVLQDLDRVVQSLVDGGEQRNVQARAEQLLNFINLDSLSFSDNDLEVIETWLSQRITANLHRLPSEQWTRTLSRIRSAYLNDVGADSDLQSIHLPQSEAELDLWVSRLDKVEDANHPRDVTLTIAWIILTIARHNLQNAVKIIYRWLTSDDSKARTMGMACTKLLFNFYDCSPTLVSEFEEITPILSLLEPFMKACETPADFRPIWRILMSWSREEAWATRLSRGTDKGNELLTAANAIKTRQNVFALRQLLAINETLMALAVLNAKLGLSLADFRAYLRQVELWRQRFPKREDRRDRVPDFIRSLNERYPLTVGLIDETEAIFEKIRIEINDRRLSDSTFTMSQMVYSLAGNLEALRRAELQTLQRAQQNMLYVAEAVRLQLLGHLNQEMPELRGGKRYGVILVSTSPDSGQTISTVLGFLKHFQGKLKEFGRDNIILTLHRLGRKETVYTNTLSLPSRRDLRPDGLPHHVPLISPTLELYSNPSQVAFVLIATAERPIDLEDWQDEADWRDLFIFSTRRQFDWLLDFWGGLTSEQVNRRIKDDIIELTETILEKIKA